MEEICTFLKSCSRTFFFLYLGPSARVKKKLFSYFVLSDFVVIKIEELFTLSIPFGMHGRQRLKMSLQKIAAFNDTRQRLRMMIKVKRNKISSSGRALSS